MNPLSEGRRLRAQSQKKSFLSEHRKQTQLPASARKQKLKRAKASDSIHAKDDSSATENDASDMTNDNRNNSVSGIGAGFRNLDSSCIHLDGISTPALTHHQEDASSVETADSQKHTMFALASSTNIPPRPACMILNHHSFHSMSNETVMSTSHRTEKKLSLPQNADMFTNLQAKADMSLLQKAELFSSLKAAANIRLPQKTDMCSSLQAETDTCLPKKRAMSINLHTKAGTDLPQKSDISVNHQSQTDTNLPQKMDTSTHLSQTVMGLPHAADISVNFKTETGIAARHPENYSMEGLNQGELDDEADWAESKKKRTEAKRNRNLGLPYLSSSKKPVQGRRHLGPRCEGTVCKIRQLCCIEFSDTQREEILRDFWDLGNLELQRQWVAQHLNIQNFTSRKRKQRNIYYSLPRSNKRLPVCKAFFLNTLSLTDRFIRTVLEKVDSFGIVEGDNRGGRQQLELDMVKRRNIMAHITQMLQMESLSDLSFTGFQYLAGDLTVTKMHDAYMNDDIGREHPVSFSLYRKVFAELKSNLMLMESQTVPQTADLSQNSEMEIDKNLLEEADPANHYHSHFHSETDIAMPPESDSSNLLGKEDTITDYQTVTNMNVPLQSGSSNLFEEANRTGNYQAKTDIDVPPQSGSSNLLEEANTTMAYQTKTNIDVPPQSGHFNLLEEANTILDYQNMTNIDMPPQIDSSSQLEEAITTTNHQTKTNIDVPSGTGSSCSLQEKTDTNPQEETDRDVPLEADQEEADKDLPYEADISANIAQEIAMALPKPEKCSLEAIELTEAQIAEIIHGKRKQSEAKRNRNLGLPYLSSSKKLIQGRRHLGPRCEGTVCKKRKLCCIDFSDKQREDILCSFWDLGNLDLQRQWVAQYLKTKILLSGKRKQRTIHYSLPCKSKILPVCRAFFLNTLHLTEKFVRTVLEKLDSYGIVQGDNRGGRQQLELDLAKRRNIMAHITQLLKIESDSCMMGRPGDCQYLPSHLTISKMYEMYMNDDIGRANPVSDSLYRRVFTELKNKLMLMESNSMLQKVDPSSSLHTEVDTHLLQQPNPPTNCQTKTGIDLPLGSTYEGSHDKTHYTPFLKS